MSCKNFCSHANQKAKCEYPFLWPHQSFYNHSQIILLFHSFFFFHTKDFMGGLRDWVQDVTNDPPSHPKKQVAALEGAGNECHMWHKTLPKCTFMWHKTLPKCTFLSHWSSVGLRGQNSKIWEVKLNGTIMWTWSCFLCCLSSFFSSSDFYKNSGWRWNFQFPLLKKNPK